MSLSTLGNRVKAEEMRLIGSLAVRGTSALFGAYIAAAATATVVARVLPIARAEATAWGLNLSFLIYACLALWAFAERRVTMVAGMIWGTAALAAGVMLLLGPRT